MARANFTNQTKRTRELAKKDKREAKDKKRAQKKADARAARAVGDGTALSPPAGAVSTKPATTSNVRSLAAAAFIRRMNKTP